MDREFRLASPARTSGTNPMWQKCNKDGAGMRSLVLSVAATLAFAGASVAQTTEVLRHSASGATTHKKAAAAPAAKSAVHKTAAAAHTQQTPPVKQTAAKQAAIKRPVTPQSLRGTRYGGFAPGPAQPVTPPVLDLNSPRSLSLLNVNSRRRSPSPIGRTAPITAMR